MESMCIYMENQDIQLMDPLCSAFSIGGNILTNVSLGTCCSPTKSALDHQLSHAQDRAKQKNVEFYIKSIEQNIPDLRQLLDVILPPVSGDSAINKFNFLETSECCGSPDPNMDEQEFYSLQTNVTSSSSTCDSLMTETTCCSRSDSTEGEIFHSAPDSLNYSSEDDKDVISVSECPDSYGSFSSVQYLPVGLSFPKSLSSQISHVTADKPGYGLVSIWQQFPCLQHLLYSLLIGRPVIIVGTLSSQDIVRSVVQALDLFIPEKLMGGEVIPWSLRPLNLSIITQARLIGLGIPERKTLDSMVPYHVKNYVTLLDTEKRVFYGPQYAGGILLPMERVRKFHFDDGVLISFLHSLLLVIAGKVAQYYHCICLNEKLNESEHISSMQTWKMPEVMLSGLCLLKSDATIVKHLTEMVKMKQILYSLQTKTGEMNFPPILQVAYEKIWTLKL